MKPDDGQIRMAVNDMLGKTLRRAFTVEEFELAYRRLKHDESFLKTVEESFEEINLLIEGHEAEYKAEREAKEAMFPNLNAYGNYEYGKPLPESVHALDADGTIRRVKQLGIPFVPIVEVSRCGKRSYIRTRGYAIPKFRLASLLNTDDILKVCAVEVAEGAE
jgi:hypothetical protein